ncbi:TPA: restriction endonuclease subunit S [Aeromonas hydrophila]
MTYVTAPIKDFVDGIYDGPHATPKDSQSGKIFLGIGNVTTGGRLDLSDLKLVSEEEFPKWTKRVTPRAGDVVFSYEATLHRYALIPEGFDGCLGRRMALVRPNKERILPRYLHYYFLSPKWRAYADERVVIGATVNRLPIKDFPNFEITVPDVSIQEKVVNILSRYDELIENNNRRIRLLEESAHLLFREWFVYFRFPGHEHSKIINDLPEGWMLGVVADLGQVVTGKTPSTTDQENFGGNIPFIKTPDMHASPIIVSTEECLSEKGAKTQEKKFIPANSILVACIGAKLGVVSINAIEAQTNQQINSVIPKCREITYFAYFTLKAFRERLLAIGGGATMPNVNKSKFESMSITLPDAALLNVFHERVESSFEQMRILIEATRKLEQARNLLLPRLMNGDIAV